MINNRNAFFGAAPAQGFETMFSGEINKYQDLFPSQGNGTLMPFAPSPRLIGGAPSVGQMQVGMMDSPESFMGVPVQQQTTQSVIPQSPVAPQGTALTMMSSQQDPNSFLIPSNPVGGTNYTTEPEFANLMQGMANHTDGSYVGNPLHATPATSNFLSDTMFGGATEGMTNKDLFTGLGSAAQIGLGAYGMFQGIGQRNEALDQGWAKIGLAQDEYNENLRQRQAITAQNRNA